MNVLVVGSGGREHALAWKLQQSPRVEQVYCAPGNAGMRGVQCVAVSGNDALADFAATHDIGLTMVGPEAPLCDGIVDVFRTRGLAIFGPDANAAQLEGSKVYAKEFMIRHGLPTAPFVACTDRDTAVAAARDWGAPVVIKADGLAAGKGVTVAGTVDEAIAAIDGCFAGAFGSAGQTVLVERCLEGEEASILAFVDRHTIKPLASSQDHKRVGEGDTGPNTGGMGAYSPAPIVDEAMWARIDAEVLQPFLRGCQRDGLDFRGIIYAGLMICDGGPQIIEFNVRFGDPETQPIMLRMTSDLAEGLLLTIEDRLADYTFSWLPDAAVCVAMASAGYPGRYEKGHAISGLDDAAAAPGVEVFHAGTAIHDGQVVTAGGRVLGVTALGEDIRAAVARAYEAVDKIHWQGGFCRRDIAHRALARL